MQGRSDRLTNRSVNVMSPEEAAAKNLPSVYTLPGTNGASKLVSKRREGGGGLHLKLSTTCDLLRTSETREDTRCFPWNAWALLLSYVFCDSVEDT